MEEVSPRTVAVEGGERISIQGDNFGPACTPVTVEPTRMLRCDHSNTSHTRIACVTLPGRGDGLPVHVTVEGQRSDETHGGDSTNDGNGGGAGVEVSGEQSGTRVVALVNISYFPPLITSVDPNRGAANSPEKITIYGNSFGKSPTNVRAFIGGRPCANAAWMPENPPKYQKSYIQCNPPDGDVSGEKNITLIFSDDISFSADKLLYDPLHFDGMYVEERRMNVPNTCREIRLVTNHSSPSTSNIYCPILIIIVIVAISCSGTQSPVLQGSTAL